MIHLVEKAGEPQ